MSNILAIMVHDMLFYSGRRDRWFRLTKLSLAALFHAVNSIHISHCHSTKQRFMSNSQMFYFPVKEKPGKDFYDPG